MIPGYAPEEHLKTTKTFEKTLKGNSCQYKQLFAIVYPSIVSTKDVLQCKETTVQRCFFDSKQVNKIKLKAKK